MRFEGGSPFKVSLSNSNNRPRPRWLNIVLFAVALIGWLTFVVACVSGPAWSPDGSKILYGYHDSENQRSVIALYDRKTHKSRNLFSQPIPKDKKDENFLLVPAWQADGSRALVWTVTEAGDDEVHCVVASIPVNSQTPLQVFNLGKKVSCLAGSTMPQVGSKLYFGGDEQLTTLDLATGEIDAIKIEGGSGEIAEHNGQIVYVRGIKRPSPTAENKDATEDGLEVGQVDLREIKLLPSFALWQQDLNGTRMEDVVGASWEPGSSRIAVVVKGSESDSIMILDEKKVMIADLKPDLGVKGFHLGRAVWTPDRKALYSSAIFNGDKKGDYVYALAEIPVNVAQGRVTKIVGFHNESISDSDQSDLLYFGLQVSLSPDGNTIAASTAALRDSVGESDRALFLIDVAHPERRIARVAPPKNAPSR